MLKRVHNRHFLTYIWFSNHSDFTTAFNLVTTRRAYCSATSIVTQAWHKRDAHILERKSKKKRKKKEKNKQNRAYLWGKIAWRTAWPIYCSANVAGRPAGRAYCYGETSNLGSKMVSSLVILAPKKGVPHKISIWSPIRHSTMLERVHNRHFLTYNWFSCLELQISIQISIIFQYDPQSVMRLC